MQNVLIIGGNSYIGTELSKYLSKFKAYKLYSIDIGFNDDCVINHKSPLFLSKKIDVRDINEEFLDNFNTVIFLAGLSLFLINPIKSISEYDAYKITEEYTKKIIIMCKKKGIKFLFPSSCSVYGISDTNNFVNEVSNLNPITLYSKNKIILENFIKEEANSKFNPVILRLATVFGYSERMRFDIVVNMLVGMAISTNEIILNSDGQVYRPFVDIRDVCKAFEYFIRSDYSNYDVDIFNVGSNENNYKIIEIAKLIQKIIPDTNIKFLNENHKINKNLIQDNHLVKNQKDERNYKVNFDKISSIFKDFKNSISLKEGIINMAEKLKKINLDIDDFNNIKFHRLQNLNHLIETGKVNSKLEYINNLQN